MIIQLTLLFFSLYIQEVFERAEADGLDFKEVVAEKLLKQSNSKICHLHDLIKAIVHGSMPLNISEKKYYQRLVRDRPTVSRKLVKDMIFELVEIVKKNISSEMKEAEVGSISYDAWEKFFKHYLAVIATYVLKDGTIREVLLSLSPVLGGLSLSDFREQNPDAQDGEYVVVDDNDGDVENKRESVVFTAEAYAPHIKAVVESYDVIFAVWVLCQLADNTNLNPKIARLLEIFHVGCKNHAVDLDVGDALTKKAEDDPWQNNEIVDTIDSVGLTIRDLRNKDKAAANRL